MLKVFKTTLCIFSLLFVVACSNTQPKGKFASDNLEFWPESLPNELPLFGYGKIGSESNVTTNTQTQWKISFTENEEGALESYRNELKESGWKMPKIYVKDSYQYLVTDQNDYYLEVYRSLENDGILLELKKL